MSIEEKDCRKCSRPLEAAEIAFNFICALGWGYMMLWTLS